MSDHHSNMTALAILERKVVAGEASAADYESELDAQFAALDRRVERLKLITVLIETN